MLCRGAYGTLIPIAAGFHLSTCTQGHHCRLLDLHLLACFLLHPCCCYVLRKPAQPCPRHLVAGGALPEVSEGVGDVEQLLEGTVELGLQDSGDLSSSLRDGNDKLTSLTLTGSKFSSSMAFTQELQGAGLLSSQPGRQALGCRASSAAASSMADTAGHQMSRRPWLPGRHPGSSADRDQAAQLQVPGRRSLLQGHPGLPAVRGRRTRPRSAAGRQAVLRTTRRTVMASGGGLAHTATPSSSASHGAPGPLGHAHLQGAQQCHFGSPGTGVTGAAGRAQPGRQETHASDPFAEALACLNRAQAAFGPADGAAELLPAGVLGSMALVAGVSAPADGPVLAGLAPNSSQAQADHTAGGAALDVMLPGQGPSVALAEVRLEPTAPAQQPLQAFVASSKPAQYGLPEGAAAPAEAEAGASRPPAPSALRAGAAAAEGGGADVSRRLVHGRLPAVQSQTAASARVETGDSDASISDVELPRAVPGQQTQGQSAAGLVVPRPAQQPARHRARATLKRKRSSTAHPDSRPAVSAGAIRAAAQTSSQQQQFEPDAAAPTAAVEAVVAEEGSTGCAPGQAKRKAGSAQAAAGKQ